MAAKQTPEAIERVRTLKEMGWTAARISRHEGVSESTVKNWLKRAEDPSLTPVLDAARLEQRKRFVDEAWEIVHAVNAIMKERIAEGDLKRCTPPQLATVQAIYIDKISVIDGKGQHRDSKPTVNITIIPPEQKSEPAEELGAYIVEEEN